MKNIVFYLLLLFLISCSPEYNFYDIDGPLLDFYTFTEDEIFFQFNEPVLVVKYVLINREDQKEIIINNFFPTANVFIPMSFFVAKERKSLQIEVTDTSNNKSFIKLSSPVVNNNPVLLAIKEVRIKYSKKRKQKIVLRALTSGSVAGYKMILFIRGKKAEIPFLFEKINKGKRLEVFIMSSKENKEYNYELGFLEENITLCFKNRLSQISSLILILNNKGEVLDYFLYYNSKKYPISYYESNKYLKKLKNELILNNIQPVLFDIADSTAVKTIQKVENKFLIID